MGPKRDRNGGERDQNGTKTQVRGTKTGPKKRRDQNGTITRVRGIKTGAKQAWSERHQSQHVTKMGPKRWRAGPKRDQNTGARDQNGCQKSVVRAPPERAWDQNGTLRPKN